MHVAEKPAPVASVKERYCQFIGSHNWRGQGGDSLRPQTASASGLCSHGPWLCSPPVGHKSSLTSLIVTQSVQEPWATECFSFSVWLPEPLGSSHHP